MKVSCAFLLLALFLMSCGNSGRSPATESQLGSALISGGEYTAAEKNIALRICYAYRSKNTNFRANFIGTSFLFNVSVDTCEGDSENETLTTTLQAPLASQPMVYDSTSPLDYYKEVLTEQAGPLSPVCSALLKGGEPLKSILQGNNLIEISFFANDIDNIIVRKAKKTGSNYIVYEEQRFQVDSDSDLGNRIGQIKLFSKEKQCANGRVETLTQQFINQ